ncbi:ribosomal RNA processing protein 1 homolog B, partial [Bufo bufo]|uniref:ribosomal RNA processing protein 1 homolog B n=1 Tax=Bufo bufo TaxID=8384 RepID=UPI001ABE3E5D
SQDTLNEPAKKGKRQRTVLTPENPPEPPAPKKKRKKNAPNQVNGVTHEHPSIREETEECVLQSPPEPDASQESSSTTGTRLRRRRRSCLLRLGLSVLPLRGALMLRRRRLIREQRKISSKADPMMSADIVTSTPVCPSPPHQDFITFQKSEVPKPLYVKGAKSRGRPISAKVKCKSKKVTFSLNKNMTAEFKRTDRSLLVSPTGSSRVPFNPSQRPQHGVLKTPTPPRSLARRARAVDFF